MLSNSLQSSDTGDADSSDSCSHVPLPPPSKSDCRGSCIKLTWLRDLKENLQLTDENSIQRYVKCHIMLLIGTILFGDKFGASMHWKFLPLLRDFGSIGQYSWGSHTYTCSASRYECKEIHGPLTLLLGWAWICLPYLVPLPRKPRSFSLANRHPVSSYLKSNCVNEISHIRWRNWERGDRHYRYLTLAHFRKALDDLQEGQLLGFMAADAGQSQYAQQPDYFMAGRYSLDAWHSCRTSSGASGGFVSVDSSRSDGDRGILNSQNPNRV
ncbi:hypothetical protein Ahy_B03g066036 isoform A [Arachis hypogaea]|uniref:Aminotransferase-like plant mobile domain-containing protein n=1 Tax=Arachis hypogaea TaxID=3818 RepID=A0A445A2X2_ARAHY|nr:hypothetical protein Ahy_B03g066036 isoform A [Arachis hypogaea]